MRIVLAIDPGYDRCGVAVILDDGGKNPVLLHSECIETTPTDNFSFRLGFVIDQISSVLDTYKPHAAAIEEIFFSNNQKTAMQIAAVRGALLYLFYSRNVPVSEYNPQNIKIAITGYGRSDKAQVLAMLPKLILLPTKDALDDEYDAIAVGLTHLATSRKKIPS